MRKIYLHPTVLVILVWTSVYFAYTLHWSNLQSICVNEANGFIALIYFAFIGTTLLYYLTRFAISKKCVYKANYHHLSLNLGRWYLAWVVLTIIEIIYSRGIPLIWLLTGSDKNYFDFGIPSIHGFANGLISGLSLLSFFRFVKSGKKRDLFLSLMIILWGIIAVTRQIIIVNLIQFIIIYFAFRPPRIVSLLRFVIIATLLFVAFGWLGDIRTGADKFVSLAMPSDDYPDYFPSGILWAYIYAVTPLMNLLNTFGTSCGCESWFFGNTISPLFPSVLRSVIFDTSKTVKGELVTEAFNVSTAFVDPFTDNGYLGIFIFSVLISIITHHYWRKTCDMGVIIYAILAQCLILTIFYNHFFSLPVISQILWIVIIFNTKTIHSVLPQLEK